MLKYPENYEEAKIIIRNAVDGEIEKREHKIDILRATLASAACIGIAVTVGVVEESQSLGLGSFLLTLPMTVRLIIPYFARKERHKEILNGDYFARGSKERIIENAKKYVDQYNEYEENQNRRRSK